MTTMMDDRSKVGHYGPGYGERDWHLAPDDEHSHYRRFREEHARQLDEEYQQWCRQRFSGDFEDFRRSRTSRGSDPLGRRDPLAPRDEGPMQSLGRAVSETVAGTRQPELEERKETERFFERS
jgi:hypothetical protein